MNEQETYTDFDEVKGTILELLNHMQLGSLKCKFSRKRLEMIYTIEFTQERGQGQSEEKIRFIVKNNKIIII